MLARSLALLVLCVPVSAQFSDDFESYAAGSAIEGQGGWQNWDSIGQGNQAINTVENAPPAPLSGNRMLRVVGSGNPNCSGCSDTIHQLGGPYTSGQWTFRVYQYLPLNYFGDQWVMLLNDWSDGNAGPFNWSMAMHMDSNSSMCVNDISAAASPVSTGGNQPLIYDQWVEIKAEIDLDADTCEVYYGGVSMFTFTWSVGSSNGTLAEIEILDLFAFENDTEVFYDDVSLTSGSGSVSVVCDPAMDHSGGNYTKLDNSTLGAPTGILSGLHLEAVDGPPGEFGYFLVSAGANASLPVSNGVLCLDGPQGRYAPAAGVAPLNSIGSFNASGAFESLIQQQQGWDVPNGLPTPPGGVIGAGQTWYFQMWYRDGQRSNFSNAIGVTF